MNRLHQWIRTHTERLMAEGTSPVRLGVAVGIGVFFACTPFYGFQLWLALAVAWIFRLNKVAVVIGTQFSLPPLIPFIVFASAWTGERLLHGRSLALSLNQLRDRELTTLAREFGLAWTVGGAVVGLVAGTLIGSVVAIVAARRARTASPNEAPAPASAAATD
ncbi:MAG: DUF2062 domain-containing protein [Gemmatimonas sp.]